MKIGSIFLCVILLLLLPVSCSARDTTAVTRITDPGRTASYSSTPAQADSIAPSAAIKAEKVIETWEEYDASPMPLIAAIPEKNIYMYALKPGSQGLEEAAGEKVKLVMGDREQLIEWCGLTPRFFLPQLGLGDYDGDGTEELSVIFYVGSGTGVSIDSLHIFRQPDKQGEGLKDGDMEELVFEPKDYISQLNKLASFQPVVRNGVLMGEVTVNSEKYEVDMREYQSPEYGTFYKRIAWGEIARFQSENGKLRAEFGVGVTSDKIIAPVYIGTVYADIQYANKRFALENLRFEGNPE